MDDVSFRAFEDPAPAMPVATAQRLEDLEERFEAAAARLWDARLQYMLMESDRGRGDPAVAASWERYQDLRNQCAVLLAEIERFDAEQDFEDAD